MESEFIVLELAGQEVEWLKGLLANVPMWGKQATPISLHYDSHAAMGVAHNSVYNGKRRHIHIRHSAVKQLLKTWRHIPTICEIREEFGGSSH